MALTYVGTTGGSTSANPPVELAGAISGQVPNSQGLTGAKLWFYSSTNAATDMGTTGAFSDGYPLGMRLGDVVIGVTATAASTAPILWLGAIGLSSAGGGANLSTQSIITSTFA